jgi:hypothetical protein
MGTTRTGAWDQPVAGGDKSYVAGGTINQFDAVKFDSTEGQVVQAGAITDDVVGFAQTKAASGEPLTIRTLGVSKFKAKNAVTYGQQLMPSTTAGQCSTAAGATAKSCGVCVHAAADGEYGSIDITPPGNRPPNA